MAGKDKRLVFYTYIYVFRYVFRLNLYLSLFKWDLDIKTQSEKRNKYTILYIAETIVLRSKKRRKTFPVISSLTTSSSPQHRIRCGSLCAPLHVHTTHYTHTSPEIQIDPQKGSTESVSEEKSTHFFSLFCVYNIRAVCV